MIPNKIYLPKYPNYDIEGEHLGDDWAYEPEFIDNVTYIRKEALLEWAKERREAVAKEVVIQEGVRLGADAALEELIDKLNEM